MKILVTGGAGFIGSCFIRLLLEGREQVSVTNLDVLTYAGNLDNLLEIKDDPRYRFVHGNICDRQLVESLLKQEAFDAIVNIAAESHVDRSIVKPGQFIETNVVGTQVLLESALSAGCKRFLQVSTDEVYGSLSGDANAPTVFSESDPLDPSNPYSASKAAADLLCLAFHKTHGFPVIISRCVNNYGPFQFPEKLIPVVIQKALRNEKIPIYGNGRNVRTWIHVKDHCEALRALLKNAPEGSVFNISSGEEIDNLTLAKTILSILGKNENLLEFVQDRPGHDWRYALDAKRIKQHCGWQARIKLKDGLKETVDWYRAHESWIARALSKI